MSNLEAPNSEVRSARAAEKGTLFVVSTPIGNLEDITLRALKVLSEVAVIAAEDTRSTHKLLKRHEIDARLLSYHDHSDDVRRSRLIERLEQGDDVALVSDAGTPAVCDPGFGLIASAIKNDIQVVAIPGASALLGALVVSGLPPYPFRFEGFLPRKQSQRRNKLEALSDETSTLIFYEAPHRMEATLSDMLAALGDRACAVSRELTKLYEETIRGTISSAIEAFKGNTKKGEMVIVVSGADHTDQRDNLEELITEVRECTTNGMSTKDAVAVVSRNAGVSRRKLYDAVNESQ